MTQKHTETEEKKYTKNHLKLLTVLTFEVKVVERKKGKKEIEKKKRKLFFSKYVVITSSPK